MLKRMMYSLQSMADRLGLFVQAHTLYSSVRPLGAGTIIGTYLDGEATLYMIEPSGVYWVNLLSFFKVCYFT
jgi:20S proteasome subunit alpha 7